MHDMTYVKGAALKRLAPDIGGYMNEGDRNDPDWKTAFYRGKSLEHLAMQTSLRVPQFRLEARTSSQGEHKNQRYMS